MIETQLCFLRDDERGILKTKQKRFLAIWKKNSIDQVLRPNPTWHRPSAKTIEFGPESAHNQVLTVIERKKEIKRKTLQLDSTCLYSISIPPLKYKILNLVIPNKNIKLRGNPINHKERRKVRRPAHLEHG